MPSVIRKSDGKVFDVFGTLEGIGGSFFLLHEYSVWRWQPITSFEPATIGPGEITVAVEPQLVPPMSDAIEETLQHDPDLEAQ